MEAVQIVYSDLSICTDTAKYSAHQLCWNKVLVGTRKVWPWESIMTQQLQIRFPVEIHPK